MSFTFHSRAVAENAKASTQPKTGLLKRDRIPGDTRLEQEADRLADAVMLLPPAVMTATPLDSAIHPHTSKKTTISRTIATDVLPSPGSLIEPAIRQDMEQRFGHDFSRVRLHTDGEAARNAQSLGAQAFAYGSSIVFGKNAFSPGTRAGRNLLAHELAHVVQQSMLGVETRPMLRPQRSPDTSTAAPAPDPLAAARTTLAELQRQAGAFASAPPTDLSATLLQLLTSFNTALRAALADATQAALVSDLRRAYTEAVRSALEAYRLAQRSPIRDPPSLQSLFEQYRDEIEPFALPTATMDSAAQQLMAELDAPLPDRATSAQRARHAALASARRQMRVVTSQITLGLENLFSTAGGTTTIPLPTHATVRYSSSVPAVLQRGLSNVAGQIFDTPLSANTTMMLALDLRPYGGGYDAYRFTRLDIGTTATPAIEILVEMQGAIGVEGLLAQQRTDLLARFTRAGFRRGNGFSDTEFDQVLIGAGEIPEAQLSALSGLRFVQEPASAAHPRAAAEYDQATHTVHVFDNAYSSGMMRMGRAGHVLQFAAHAIAHEIGHARDLSSLRTTAAATTAAQDALMAEFGTGGGSYTVPGAGHPDRARYDELNAPLTAARTAERAARSRSGARWGPDTSTADPDDTTVVDTLPASEATPAFRAAARRDDGPGSPRMPTTYPDPESVLQEYYAESFALYRTSPDLLRRIRPNVFAYFESESA